MIPSFDVIVPVRNEAVQLAKTGPALKVALDGLSANIIYVLNDTHDQSADVIRKVFGNGAQIITLPSGGKTAALRAGDEASNHNLRVYIDADVVVNTTTFPALLAPLVSGVVDLVAPRFIVDLSQSHGLALRIGRVWSDQLERRTDAFFCCTAFNTTGLHQRGIWPDILADDDWARDQIAPARRLIVENAQADISPPRSVMGWLTVRARWRRGTRQLRRMDQIGKITKSPRPRGSWIDLGLYYTIRLMAEPLSYAQQVFGVEWGKDTSTRMQDHG